MSKYKICLKYAGLPILGGAVVGFLSGDGMKQYGELPKPPLSPPGWVFPIVWIVLYIMMGIAACIIHNSNHPERNKALKRYWIQIIVNLIWPILFFGLGQYWIAFAWLVILFLLILSTIVAFGKINKIASRLLIPYLIWVLFAGYLNISFAMM